MVAVYSGNIFYNENFVKMFLTKEGKTTGAVILNAIYVRLFKNRIQMHTHFTT